MLSKHIYRTGLRALRRHISTGEAAVTQPLHFRDGKRVNPTNPDATHDFAVLEPATGMCRNIETFPSVFLALTMTVLIDTGNGTRIKFAWKNTKKLTTHLILVLVCFRFFQANFILVPFPTHRQQVPSISVRLNSICIWVLLIWKQFCKTLISPIKERNCAWWEVQVI